MEQTDRAEARRSRLLIEWVVEPDGRLACRWRMATAALEQLPLAS